MSEVPLYSPYTCPVKWVPLNQRCKVSPSILTRSVCPASSLALPKPHPHMATCSPTAVPGGGLFFMSEVILWPWILTKAVQGRAGTKPTFNEFNRLRARGRDHAALQEVPGARQIARPACHPRLADPPRLVRSGHWVQGSGFRVPGSGFRVHAWWGFGIEGGTSLIRNRAPLGPSSRPMSGVPLWFLWGGRFLMSEATV